jgi:hypothetical protein
MGVALHQIDACTVVVAVVRKFPFTYRNVLAGGGFTKSTVGLMKVLPVVVLPS